MDSTDATVLVIDDDADVRAALARLLRAAGWSAITFASAQDFVDAAPYRGIGCVVLDVRMPGMSGPELHDWMRTQGLSLPVIFLSGYCDVPMSVYAMKHGALDVLQKPADDEVLLEAIGAAVEQHRRELLRHAAIAEVIDRLRSLSAREREVMEHVVRGRLNKQIASDLGIVEKTVKVHRGRVMAKMRVRSVAELVHLWE